MSKKKILEEFEKKFTQSVAGNGIFVRGGYMATKGEVRRFFSEALTTIEKETKEEMAKALKEKLIGSDGEFNKTWEGYPKKEKAVLSAVRYFINKAIDNYLKKEVK